jgi:hypothetical protein
VTKAFIKIAQDIDFISGGFQRPGDTGEELRLVGNYPILIESKLHSEILQRIADLFTTIS